MEKPPPVLAPAKPFGNRHKGQEPGGEDHGPDLRQLAAESHNSKIKLVSAEPLGFWLYHGCDDRCVVCLQPLMALCPRCESSNLDTSKCEVEEGKCDHKIHTHCRAMFENRGLCLLCYQPWATKRLLPI